MIYAAIIGVFILYSFYLELQAITNKADIFFFITDIMIKTSAYLYVIIKWDKITI